jgi:DNA-binding MarR family transcriptional regulator
MVFWGRQYYQEFVSSPEGIATNTLADRLLRLQEAGIITQERDPDDGRRHRYVLTEQGVAAIPLLLDLVLWGAQLDPALGYPAPVLRWISNDRDEVIRYYRQKLLTRDPSRTDAPHRLPGTRG